MKKIIILTIIVLLMTGCSNTITCKTKNSDVQEEYNIKYKNNNISKITIKKTYKFTDKKEFEQFETFVKYNASKENENIKSSYKKKNKKYIIKQIYKVEKMTDDELNKHSLNKNKEEFVNNLKDNGLTCK